MLKNISDILKLQPEQGPEKHLYLYLFIAYTFGVALRFMLLYQSKDISSLWIDGAPLPIWTADAGRYGFFAKEILSGVDYPSDPIYTPGYLIAFITSFLQADIDWVMLLLPIFLAPLIVIPMILIGKALKLTQFGFLSALVSVTAINFYMRTYLGYMDTDGLNLFFILMIVYFMIKTLLSNNLLYALGGGLTILAFSLWYHSSASINLAIIAAFFTITFIFYRQNSSNYQAFIIFSIALIPYNTAILASVLLITSLLFTLLNRYKTFSYQYYLIVLFFGIVLVLSIFDLSHYYHRAMQYFNKETLNTFDGNGITYHYTSFLQYVSETQKAYFWNSQPGLSNMLIYTLFATIGYLLLSIAYPAMWIFLPILLLGLLSFLLGVRFTLYASPVLSFGIIYIFYILRNSILYKYPKADLEKFMYFTTSIILIFMINNIFLYNNILKRNIYPLFKGEEAKLLKNLSKDLSKDDKIIASWELGWPLWYYTGYQNTLTDNGLHGGPDTHAIAKIFMSPNQQFTYNTSKYLSAKLSESEQHGSKFILPYLARSQDLNILFENLEKDFPAVQSKGDTYILVHSNMLNYIDIFGQFAATDMKTGKGKGVEEFSAFVLDGPYIPDDNSTTGIPYIFDHKKGTFMLPFSKVEQKINRVITIDKHQMNKEYLFHANSSYYLIAEDNKYLFYINRSTLQSFLIQTFLLDNYDRRYFEKVSETKRMKIFKVKN